MGLVVADRVKETTTTTGTGALTLAGAMTAFRAFSSVCANQDVVFYAVQAVDANGATTGDWEVGQGTYSAGTLARDIILSSSNGGSVVSFSAGTKQVWIDVPAASISGAPGVTPEFWFDASLLTGASGSNIGVLVDSARGNHAYASTNAPLATVGASLLNGRKVANFGNAGSKFYGLLRPFCANWAQTVFAVINPNANSTTNGNFLTCGDDGSQVFRLYGGQMQFLNANVAVSAADSTVLAAGTWKQINGAYDLAAGVATFRVGRAASSAPSITNPSTLAAPVRMIGMDQHYGSSPANSLLAELIVYSAALTPAQVSAVENYLYNKWGV